LALELTPEGIEYEDWERTLEFHAGVVDALRAHGGIDAVGATSALPLQTAYKMRYSRPDRPEPSAPVSPVQHISVEAGYFETVGASRVGSGRFFTPSDDLSSEPVMVINESLARLAFPDEDPVGQFLVPSAISIGPFGYNLPGTVPFRIVGVIADIHQVELRQANEPAMYFSQRQFPSRTMFVTLRGPEATTEAVAEAVRGVDGSVPIGPMRSLRDRLLAASAPARLLLMVLGAFAVGMTVACVGGVYSLLSWSVNRRRRELAIRQALGARPGSLATRVTVEGLLLTGVGCLAGGILALLAAGTLGPFLFETSVTDPLVFGVAISLLGASAVAAGFGPARRALRLDPAAGLRGD
jgi:putative ABC transport system permease protein